MTRRGLLRILEAALADLDLSRRVADALPVRPPRGLPVRVLAIGKASPTMAAGAIAHWGRFIESMTVVAPRGVDAAMPVLRAGHPLPDASSVRAAERCLADAARMGAATILVLVSGGASSLVCAPSRGVSLRQKRDVIDAMLRSGARIQEINVVRKHLSRIKGGGLARAAGRNRVVTLVASDVIRGTATDVGSGPSVADPSSVADARGLLRRFAPRLASLPLVRTPRIHAARAKIIASPEELAEAAAERLRATGLRVRILRASQASALDVAREYASLRLAPGSAIVRAAEPSVEVPAGAGRGGRASHLAALVARDIPRGARFMAAATDGADGASGTAGAIIDASLVARVGRVALDRAIMRFDTGSLLREAGAAIDIAPRSANFADLHVLVY